VAFARRSEKSVLSPPQDLPLWLPYSGCRGFSVFHKMLPVHLFHHFGFRFGALLGTLGGQSAPWRLKRDILNTHPKTNSLKTPKSLKTTLLMFSLFLRVWMPTLSRMGPGTPFSSVGEPQNIKKQTTHYKPKPKRTAMVPHTLVVGGSFSPW